MVLKEKGAYMKRNGLLLLLMVVFLQAGCGKAEEESGEIPISTVLLEEETGEETAVMSSEEGAEGSQKETTQQGTDDAAEGQTPAGAGEASKEEPEEGTNQSSKEPEAGQLTGSDETFGFAALTGRYFYFSSGAGGWSTELQIDSDGTFAGNYHDSEMGDIGDDYPEGSVYWCVFTGRFDELEKVDDFTYRMKLVSLEYDEEPEQEKIEDNIRWISSKANGLEDGETFYVYLPGAALSKLPEDYLRWVGYFDLESIAETELPWYGLYNINTGEGFSSFEYED